MRSFLAALQFLTRLPVRLDPAPSEVELGRSLLWYPAVGLLLGMMLAAGALLAGHQAAPAAAALLLAAWVGASGALHLDGLADLADAWIGGQGDRQRTLAIMKDPHVGPVAVVVLVLVLLLKYGALLACLQADRCAALILAPLLGRTAMPVLFASTAYVRADGLGSALAAYLPRRIAVAVAVAVTLGAAAVFRTAGVLALGVSAVILFGLRAALVQRLGGFTGDCAGAVIELIEAGVATAIPLG